MRAGQVKVAVPLSFGACGYVWRPNKTAAGMTKTDARRGQRRGPGEGVGLKLAVRGTTDALDMALVFCITRRNPDYLCLNKSGKARLARLRKRRAVTLR
ncbi:hypothetical protein BAJUN_01740 [Bajunvirus bajun]|uniref:Uncharacterized protein n=1 Tax=Brevundimonas phage vB_BgoS-Bajun TaxID=2948594 RepID=A0A9E7N7I2_9CAUD|nr:hypothetical protein BAJUN_01740 [Brevundimonas phage vB_BgoS-Bajun]